MHSDMARKRQYKWYVSHGLHLWHLQYTGSHLQDERRWQGMDRSKWPVSMTKTRLFPYMWLQAYFGEICLTFTG